MKQILLLIAALLPMRIAFSQQICQFDIFDINKSVLSNIDHCMDVNNKSYSIKIQKDRIRIDLKDKSYKRTFTIYREDSIWIRVNKFKVISPGYPIEVDSTIYLKDSILFFRYWDNQLLSFSCLLKISDSLYYHHYSKISTDFKKKLFKNIKHFIQNNVFDKIVQIPEQHFDYKCLVRCSGIKSDLGCTTDTITDKYPLFLGIPYIYKR